MLSYTSGYLEILWNDPTGIERIPVHEVGDVLRVAHADALSPSGHRTNLESLEALEALERIERAAATRTFKNERERSYADDLVRRSFATDGCTWDKKHAGQLLALALKPDEVSVVFRLRERLHRLFCSRSPKRKPSERPDLTVKKPPSAQTFDLGELRQDLSETQTEAPEVYKAELEPLLDRLEAKYGNNVPVAEMEGLRQAISSKLAEIEDQRKKVINIGAREGKTIEIESLRVTLEASKAAHTGADRNAYSMEIDKLLASLAAKYGSSIPVDHAYKIMQELEAGLGYKFNE